MKNYPVRLILALIFFILNCGNPLDDLSDKANLISFSFQNLEEGETVIDGASVLVNVLYDTDVTQLITVFSVSEGANVFVDDIEQQSGSTVNDFTNTVTYKVVAEDGKATTNWTVTVNVLAKPTHIVSTLIDNFPGDSEISVDENGTIFVNSSGSNGVLDGKSVYKVEPDGTFSLLADNLPIWVVGSILSSSEELLVTGWSAGVVSKININTQISTSLITGLNGAGSLEVDSSGRIYVAEYLSNHISRYDSNGGNREIFSSGSPIKEPAGLSFSKNTGKLYVSNWTNGNILEVNQDGSASVFVTLPVSNVGPIKVFGDYMIATSPQFHQIFKIDMASKQVELFAGTGGKGNVDDFSLQSTFNTPTGIGISSDSTLIYISETTARGHGRLRVVAPFE